MLPVLDADQVRTLDRLTMEREPIASIDLMERAAHAFVAALVERAGSTTEACVLCGPGNNGGDGLAIARILAKRGWNVRVVVPGNAVGSSADNRLNLSRLGSFSVPVLADLPALRAGDLVVDALFGTGLSRPLGEPYRGLVRSLHASRAEVVSVDLPSGAFAGGGPADPDAVVRAAATFTFQAPKPFLLLPEHRSHVGDLRILDIGLDPKALAESGAAWSLTEEGDVAALLPERPSAGHKGSFGHALLLVGGRGHLGAACMAVAAATRSGAGLVTACVPRGAAPVLHAQVPEAMVLEGPEADALSGPVPPGRWTALGMGPGIGQAAGTALILEEVLRGACVPLVLDADALNLLAARPALLALLPPGALLTPHPGEADRLFGAAANTRDRIARSLAFARSHGVVVLLKGAYSAVCLPDGTVRFNATGNAGMAKGGSGDVLTGLLTGLLAQGLSAPEAAVLGAWVHGLAGDIAAAGLGMDGMVAMDLVRCLPKAFQRLRKGG